jgi:predicted metal-dependent phosphotriesterase family hydrolase
MRVETVRGAMAVDGLGATLMHEHVFALTPDVMQNYGREWWDEQDQITAMLGTTPPATSPEARSEPNGSYRDSPHAQPLPASGCSG